MQQGAATEFQQEKGLTQTKFSMTRKPISDGRLQLRGQRDG